MKKQKGFIIPLIIILIVVVAVGYSFSLNKANKISNSSTEATTTSQQNGEQTVVTSTSSSTAKVTSPKIKPNTNPAISISPLSGPVGTTIKVTLSGTLPEGRNDLIFENDKGIYGYANGTLVRNFIFTVPKDIQGKIKCTNPPCNADGFPVLTAPGVYTLSVNFIDKSTTISTTTNKVTFTVTH